MARRWWIAIVVGSVILVALAFTAYLGAAAGWIEQDAVIASASVLASFAGLGAAVFTAVTALAALRAARESSHTAQQAAEALGLAMQPSLDAELLGSPYQYRQFASVQHGFESLLDEPAQIAIWNTSPWAASRVEVAVRAGDGRRGTFTAERVDSSVTRAEPIIFPFAEALPTPLDDPDWVGEIELIDELSLTFSDDRGLLRWRTSVEYFNFYSRNADGSTGEGGSGRSTTERVLS